MSKSSTHKAPWFRRLRIVRWWRLSTSRLRSKRLWIYALDSAAEEIDRRTHEARHHYESFVRIDRVDKSSKDYAAGQHDVYQYLLTLWKEERDDFERIQE